MSRLCDSGSEFVRQRRGEALCTSLLREVLNWLDQEPWTVCAGRLGIASQGQAPRDEYDANQRRQTDEREGTLLPPRAADDCWRVVAIDAVGCASWRRIVIAYVSGLLWLDLLG